MADPTPYTSNPTVLAVAMRYAPIAFPPRNLDSMEFPNKKKTNEHRYTLVVFRITRIQRRLVTIFHIQHVFHRATMVRTKAVQSTSVRSAIVRSWIPIMKAEFIKAVSVIITGFTEQGEFRSAQHRVPAHVITNRGAPLKAFCVYVWIWKTRERITRIQRDEGTSR